MNTKQEVERVLEGAGLGAVVDTYYSCIEINTYEKANGAWVDGHEALAVLIKYVRQQALDEAAQLAEDIDSGKYTATKTAAQAIRALKDK